MDTKIVMVSGKFDPAHNGHINHMLQASKLGGYLIVVVQPDEGVIAVKGKCQVPLWARMALMNGVLLNYGIKGRVCEGLDKDGKSVESLLSYRPDFYAKGGDRKPDNMVQAEIDVCEEIGCEIVYGVSEQLNQSSKMALD